MQDFIRMCIRAIQAEIDAATAGRNSERSIRVINGRFQRTSDQRHIYVFNVQRALPTSYDDAPVKLAISSHEIGGSIVGMREFEVTLALDDFLGSYIGEAQLIIDLTFILKKLKEILEERLSSLASHPTSRMALGFEEARVNEKQPANSTNDLNGPQTVALRKCLGSSFFMVWGPPGTGKTYVLARLLQEEALEGHTVLLLSNTNIAVDQALAKFLELCRTDDKLRALFEQGKFVRLGNSQVPESELLMLDQVVERLNENTRTVLEDLNRRLEPINKELANTQSKISRLSELAHLKARNNDLASSYNAANLMLKNATNDEQRISTELRDASAEMDTLRQKRGFSILIAKIAEPGLRSKITVLTKQSVDALLRVERLRDHKNQALVAWRSADSEFRRLSADAGLPETWRSQVDVLDQKVRSLNSEVDIINSQIRELEAKLSDVREQVLQGALVVACTCAKSTLDKVVIARQFDTVVIDEASMVSLPQVLWCSSLAKARFLCFGDFCQLPPISMIDQETDPDHYMIMRNSVFEQNKISLDDQGSLDDYRLKLLDEQYRMPDQICQLVSRPMYYGKLHTNGELRRDGESLHLITTSSYNAWSDKTDQFSWFNWHHAFVTVELVRQLSQGIVQPEDEIKPVLILTPFRAQAEIIESLLREASREETSIDRVASVSTVWRSQGREAKVVIFDTVCGPPFHSPGRWFLDKPGSRDGARLLNVAITRAKSKLYLIAHSEYLKRHCPPESFASQILASVEAKGIIIDSKVLTEKALPDAPNNLGGFPVLTFPSGTSAVFNDEGFMNGFAADIEAMPTGGTITIFSPFLNERSVAHWGPRLRAAIERGCRVEILTRKPGKQLAFQEFAQVETLINGLESIGAVVGFDNYVAGQRPMHHKLAILRFPNDDEEPVVWKGSMNALGHYSSEELMDRTQSMGLYGCLANLLKLEQLRAALGGRSLMTEVEAFLRNDLRAICSIHGNPMQLKLARNAKYKSFFMSCPKWRDQNCRNTINVDVDSLNKALIAVNAKCSQQECGAALEARNGRTGIYIKCSQGHFANISS